MYLPNRTSKSIYKHQRKELNWAFGWSNKVSSTKHICTVLVWLKLREYVLFLSYALCYADFFNQELVIQLEMWI